MDNNEKENEKEQMSESDRIYIYGIDKGEDKDRTAFGLHVNLDEFSKSVDELEKTLKESNINHIERPLFRFDAALARDSFRQMFSSQQTTSWVKNTCSANDMLCELRRRPHSQFPEIDELQHQFSKYCRCDDCYYQRRRLINELQQVACENR